MNWTQRARASLLLAVLLGLGAWAGTARAGVDVDFGAAIRVGDDSNLFLRISSRYFDRDPEVVQQCEAQYGDPDDVAVALFLSNRCGVPPERIFDLRRERMSWWQIGVRLGAPVDVWFVPVTHNPGPPYGRAYGYWRKFQHNPRYHFALSDREARDLVALRVMHDYYGLRPAQAMQLRERGGDIRHLVAGEYRTRHGGDKGRQFDRGDRGGRNDQGDRGGNDNRGDRGGRGRGHGRDRGGSNDNSRGGGHGQDRGRD